MTFTVPTPCNIDTVNEALIAAGYDEVEIFYDAYNSDNVSVNYRCEGTGKQFYQKQTTLYETARQWAEDFEAGYFRLQLEEDEED
jgi:predicted Zn-dependent protease